MRSLFFLLIICISLPAVSQQLTSQQFREDFEYFWNTLDRQYAYWDKKATDWSKVKALYAAEADTIKSKWNFTLFLERVFNEIYDPHASLSTNTSESQKLIPSGADVWASYQNGKPLITEVRLGFGAAR